MAFTRNAGFTSAIATNPVDTAAGYLTPDRYNLAHTVSGATVGGIPYCPTATSEAMSGMTWNASGAAGEGLAITAGTATTAVSALSATQTWNAAGVTFTGLKFTITDTASAAGSRAMQLLGGAAGTTNLVSVDKSGIVTAGTAFVAPDSSIGLRGAGGTNSGVLVDGTNFLVRGYANNILQWQSNTAGFTARAAIGLGNAADTSDLYFFRAASNHAIFSGSSASGNGGVTSRAEINKAVTAFTDGVAKTVFTLTIPNAAHSASYLVRVTGSLGAGGAIGANEASATNAYIVTMCRTAGVNAVGTISAAFGAAASNVAGATTVTCTAALAGVGGAAGATNTIDIQATITKAGGLSDNHTCVATASLLNANATGVTIA